MKNITYDAAFAPQGGPGNETFQGWSVAFWMSFADARFCTALTLGAGVQWFEAYAAANEQGRMIVGGLSGGGSVGASGGWLAGGGHSFLSPSYGLGKRLVDDLMDY